MFDDRTYILYIEHFYWFRVEQNSKRHKNKDTESAQKHLELGVIFSL